MMPPLFCSMLHLPSLSDSFICSLCCFNLLASCCFTLPSLTRLHLDLHLDPPRASQLLPQPSTLLSLLAISPLSKWTPNLHRCCSICCLHPFAFLLQIPAAAVSHDATHTVVLSKDTRIKLSVSLKIPVITMNIGQTGTHEDLIQQYIALELLQMFPVLCKTGPHLCRGHNLQISSMLRKDFWMKQ